MFHKNVSNVVSATEDLTLIHNAAGLQIVPQHASRGAASAKPPSPLLDLVVITSRRCSSFFAEAAVLVLVFGILDFFMLKRRIELHWIVGALVISLALLAASIATDFSAQRWTKAHP